MADTIEPGDFRSTLASVDKDGRRKWVEARIVWGRWRRLRLALAVPLIAFYCAIPFVSLNGHPALQIDIVHRRLYLAGLVFWPQDLSYFVIFALLGIVGTLLTVALLGRVFCGWFCPHDVFLEMVFRPIEQLIRGAPGDARRKSSLRRILVWAGFAAVAFGLANAGTALFVGPDAFRAYLFLDATRHPSAMVFWSVLFAIILFNFGWFREQTCTIVCPYGRFQTALLDQHTLVVAYDKGRGEPRGHFRPGEGLGASGAGRLQPLSSRPSGVCPSPEDPHPTAEAAPPGGAVEPTQATGGGRGAEQDERRTIPLDARVAAQPPRAKSGDCIDCGLCVRVCPTAIDIRNGNQLECIHCAACIDACDGIMAKVGRKPGLVRYASESQFAGQKRSLLRPRTLLYALVLIALTGFLAWRLATRSEVLLTPLRQTVVPVYERDPGGRDTVRAVLPLTLVNRSDHEVIATVTLPASLEALLILPQSPLILPPNARVTASPIVYIPRPCFAAGTHLDAMLIVRDPAGVVLGSAVVGIRTP